MRVAYRAQICWLAVRQPRKAGVGTKTSVRWAGMLGGGRGGPGAPGTVRSVGWTYAEAVTHPNHSPTVHGRPADAAQNSRVLAIVGFIFAFFAVLNIAGLVLCIIALVRSRRAGRRDGLALAGVIIAGIGVLITIIVVGVAAGALIDAAQTCARLGEGVHTIGTATYTCTPTSFYVSTG